jgi:pimeloyl-ACP methyl ester carboxylesterase
MSIQSLRTPDLRFSALPGFPFAPYYVEDLAGYTGLRVHYLDEGPRDAKCTWLCLHGEPSWSYLYRRMIPVFTAAGHRVVAPDFLGFGRSDKPVDDAVYTFDFHRRMLLAFVERLDLQNIRLIVQDWGGVLGLTLPMEAPQRYAGLLVMNTGLTTGDFPLTDGFKAWRAYAAAHPDLDVAALIRRDAPHLTDAEAATYAAPFPDQRYKAGVRRFPAIVPEHFDDPGAAVSREAREFWMKRWNGRSFMAIGMRDPVLGAPVMQALRQIIRGCPEPMEVPDGGHFVQEWGEEIARRALSALAD